jgi:hypothetical protein
VIGGGRRLVLHWWGEAPELPERLSRAKRY